MPLFLGDLPEHVQTVSKLQYAHHLPDNELTALLGLEVSLREFARGDDMARELTRPNHTTLMLSGFSCRYKTVPDGKRQILAFHIAGDIPDLQSLHLATMDHSIGALTQTRVALIAHEALRAVIYGNPVICHVLWRETLVDAAISREWLMGVGRLSAHGRISHLLCELLLKHKAAKLTTDHMFMLPVTQADLADALGLTPVHVNRVLQDLRQQGLIRLARGGEVTIFEWDKLQEVAAFDPTYLHLDPAERF